MNKPSAKISGSSPRVSVIVPAYNVADYLERALSSALSQTMHDIEIIVVDDASTDTTFEVAHQIAAYDSRVRVLRNERNGGTSVSRNRAIGAAQGEWIAPLDGDDVWLAERLEQLMTYADEADVVSDDVYIVRRSFSKPGTNLSWSFLQARGLTLTEPHQLSLLGFTRYDLGMLKPLIRRSFVRRHQISYDPTIRGDEDFLFHFEILAKGARWIQLPRGYYLWSSGRVGSVTTAVRQHRQVMIRTSQLASSHPAVAGNDELVAALERRIQSSRDLHTYYTIRDILRRRRLIALIRMLLEHPSNLSLMVKFVARSFYLRVVLSRKLRNIDGVGASSWEQKDTSTSIAACNEVDPPQMGARERLRVGLPRL